MADKANEGGKKDGFDLVREVCCQKKNGVGERGRYF